MKYRLIVTDALFAWKYKKFRRRRKICFRNLFSFSYDFSEHPFKMISEFLPDHQFHLVRTDPYLYVIGQFRNDGLFQLIPGLPRRRVI